MRRSILIGGGFVGMGLAALVQERGFGVSLTEPAASKPKAPPPERPVIMCQNGEREKQRRLRQLQKKAQRA